MVIANAIVIGFITWFVLTIALDRHVRETMRKGLLIGVKRRGIRNDAGL
jgi:hypothetical protein